MKRMRNTTGNFKSLTVSLLLMLTIMLTACGDKKPQASATSTPIPASPTAVLNLDERIAAEQHFEQLRELHTQMQTVWGALQRGETAQCGENYQTLPPESLPQGDPINAQLRLAASQLLEAVELWQGECVNPRQNVPQEIIDRGVLAVRGAGDALREAEVLLKGN